MDRWERGYLEMDSKQGPLLRPGGLEITDKAVQVCNFKKGDRILDVGCGSGVIVEYLGEKYGFEMTGIDKSLTLIEKGKERNPNLNIIEGNGCRLPFDTKYFDGVLMECSLSLMYNKTEAIHEAYCVLKNGGKLVIHGLYLKSITEEHLERLAKVKQEREKPHIVNGRNQCKTEEDIFRLDDCTMDGVLLLDEVMGRLEELEFKTLLLEDRSDDLKNFIAELILKYGSLEEYQKAVLPEENNLICACDQFCDKLPKSLVGYFLLITEKP
jgi:arsenite methyltransferase